MSRNLIKQLAPTGVLRAGINMGNFLLVSGRSDSGEPQGVSPDMARAMAAKLGVDVRYVPFPMPGELAEQVGNNVWDIALIGAEPQRAEKIAFSPAYVEIESTYMVPAGSKLQSIAEVDQAGVRIASTAKAAYDLWLERSIRNATVVRAPTLDAAYEAFMKDGLEALAGLRSRLVADLAKTPGARVLDGQFMAVQQAIGTARPNTEGAEFIRSFVEVAKASGFVAGLIAKHKVIGLTVAPAA